MGLRLRARVRAGRHGPGEWGDSLQGTPEHPPVPPRIRTHSRNTPRNQLRRTPPRSRMSPAPVDLSLSDRIRPTAEHPRATSPDPLLAQGPASPGTRGRRLTPTAGPPPRRRGRGQSAGDHDTAPPNTLSLFFIFWLKCGDGDLSLTPTRYQEPIPRPLPDVGKAVKRENATGTDGPPRCRRPRPPLGARGSEFDAAGPMIFPPSRCPICIRSTAPPREAERKTCQQLASRRPP